MLVHFYRTREWLCNKRPLEELGLGRNGGRLASSRGEDINGFQYEVARECATKIRDTE